MSNWQTLNKYLFNKRVSVKYELDYCYHFYFPSGLEIVIPLDAWNNGKSEIFSGGLLALLQKYEDRWVVR